MNGMLPPRLDLGTSNDLNGCYGCGPDNPIGLKLKFSWDGQVSRARFVPNEHHQGWPGIVHGGILCSLLDEAMGYVTYYMGLECVTARFDARLRCASPLHKPLLISGRLIEQTKRLVRVGGSVTFEDGAPVADAVGVMYVTNHH